VSPTSETAGTPVITVFDPFPVLTVTIEDREGHDEVHLHAGGQGLWVGRMAVSLGARVRLISAFGGEAGMVLDRLIANEGIVACGVSTAVDSAVYVHDRRSGGREELAEVKPAPLSRHELDALYEEALIESLDADAFVLAGPRPGVSVPEGTYHRLATDVGRVQERIVADLSGDTLRDALSAGTVSVVKVSDEELVGAGFAGGDDRAELLAGVRRLQELGGRDVVVTRGAEPTLALLDGAVVEVEAPQFTPNDNRGGGDAITAALAVGLARGDALGDALRLGAAAGALNVTRRGLASVEPDHAERLSRRVGLRRIDSDGAPGGDASRDAEAATDTPSAVEVLEMSSAPVVDGAGR
jgi:1-phosphofructokinase